MLPLGFSSHSPCNVTILVTSSSLFQPARPAPAHCQRPSIPCSLQFPQRTRPTDKPPARRSIAITACLQLQSCTDCLHPADLGSPQQPMAVCLPVPAAPDRPCCLTRATFPAGHVPTAPQQSPSVPYEDCSSRGSLRSNHATTHTDIPA